MKSLLTILLLSNLLPLFTGCKHSTALIVKGCRIEDPSSMTSNLDMWFCKSDADKIFSTWAELNGRLLICDSAEKIKKAAGTDDFEQAFVRLVKGESK